MNAVQTAMQKLDAAIAHRSRIGVELTPTSNMMLVGWYEDALEREEAAREVLRDAIKAQELAWDRAAYRI